MLPLELFEQVHNSLFKYYHLNYGNKFITHCLNVTKQNCSLYLPKLNAKLQLSLSSKNIHTQSDCVCRMNSNTHTFFDFLMMGCGLSSSVENLRFVGSKFSCPVK